jgi:phosphoribosylformylglycinamidine synthase
VKYKADIVVTLKNGVRDPQGSAIETVLKRTGMETDPNVAVGKYFSVVVNGESEQEAKSKLANICQEVLSNPVLEKYEIERFELTGGVR